MGLMSVPSSKHRRVIGPSAQETEAWVAFLDIYGFTNSVLQSEKKRTLPDTFDTLRGAHAEFAKKRGSLPKTFFLSDNVFFVRHVNGDNFAQFQALLADIRVFIDAFIKRKLPIRGGVSFGNVMIGPNLLVGSCVSRAVDYEKTIHAPLVIVPEIELAHAKVLGFAAPRTELVVQLPDRSFGLLNGLVVRPGNYARYKQYALEEYRNLRTVGPPRAALAWKQALDILENTSNK